MTRKQPTSKGGSGGSVFLWLFCPFLITAGDDFCSHGMVSGKHLADFPVSLMVSCSFKRIPSLSHVSILCCSTPLHNIRDGVRFPDARFHIAALFLHACFSD